MKLTKTALVVALIAIVIAVSGHFFPQAQELLGASGTRFPNGIAVGTGASVSTAGTLVIGANGSSISEFKATTCNLIGTDASQPASTTVAYDCAVTGIASGDVVMAILASSTPRFGQGWDIKAAIASTTAGFLTVLLSNETGTAAVPSATSVGSSTNVWYLDN